MKTVFEIIELFGSLADFEPIRIEPPSDAFMRLCIERVGMSRRGNPIISVAHYFEQNGDLLADPEVVFEVEPFTLFIEPMEFKTDPVVYWDFAQDPTYRNDCRQFIKEWDRNLREQGYLHQAREQANQPSGN